MAIRTFTQQEGYNTEPRKKLKKLKSVKVANLNRMRLSLKRGKSHFNGQMKTASEDGFEPSEVYVSGTSSPNYMRSTTSSSARKGSLQPSSGNIQSGSPSSSGSRTPPRKKNGASIENRSSKFSEISAEKCSDPADVKTPVMIKSKKNIKRVSSIKRSKMLSSQKSLKFRTKYSQFSNVDSSELQNSRIDIDGFQDKVKVSIGGVDLREESEGLDDNASNYGNKMAKKKGILERSRSIKMTRLKSLRSSRLRPKSRFSGEITGQTSHEAEMFSTEPQYKKGTSSQKANKISEKGLTRTSSLKPFRILAKIPSLRPRRSKNRKRSNANSKPGMSVDRATCSSTLKSSKFTDHTELYIAGRETEGFSSFHACPYSYCSLNGHHHHAPHVPVKEFIFAQRQKGKHLETHHEEIEVQSTITTESNSSAQRATVECPTTEEVTNAKKAKASEVDDDSGVDFLIKIYTKPRKKWATELATSKDAEALKDSSYKQFNDRAYVWNLAETTGETEAGQEEAFSDDHPQSFRISMIDQKPQQQATKTVVSNPALGLPNNDSKSASIKDPHDFSSKDDTEVNILSNKEEYTGIWNLIYQQLISSEVSVTGNHRINVVDEGQQDGGEDTSQDVNDLYPRQSEHNKNHLEGEDTRVLATEKVEFDQNAATKLVQEALDAILLQEEQSKQIIPGQETHFTPEVSSEMDSRGGNKLVDKKMGIKRADDLHKMEQVQLRTELVEGKMPGRNLSKNWSKLRKMVVTARCIKAIERLRKISPREPRYLSSELTAEEEKVYLRHMSMKGKKNDEEWMLDFVLRQVISRLDPDQKRRVTSLVEAFEKVKPWPNEKAIRNYTEKGELTPFVGLTTPLNKELIQRVESEPSISGELVPIQNQDDGVSISSKGVPMGQIINELDAAGNDAFGDELLHVTNEADFLHPTLESPRRNSRLVSVEKTFDEPSMENELEVPSQLTRDSEVSTSGDITNLLFDKQKYQSMWGMIYQHVVPSEVLAEEKKGINGSNDKEQHGQEIDHLDSPCTYSKNHEKDEDDNNDVCEKHELNQSAAIKLVKEAINAILQSNEQSSNQQSVLDHDRVTNDASDLSTSTPTYPVGDSSRDGDEVEKHNSSDQMAKLHQVEKSNDELQQNLEHNEQRPPQRKFSKSYSKLRKAFVTAKFIKAMERLRKFSPRKPQQLNSEPVSGEERVYLKHLSMDGKKNDEEWMLDYALRQVISKLAPDQQRKVALLADAFERVTPCEDKSIKCNVSKSKPTPSIRVANLVDKTPKQLVAYKKEISMGDDQDPQKQDGAFILSKGPSEKNTQDEDHDQQQTEADGTIQQETDQVAQSGQDDSTSSGKHEDNFNMLKKHVRNFPEDHLVTNTNFRAELYGKDCNPVGNQLHLHQDESPKVKEENTSQACSSGDPKQKTEIDTAKGLMFDREKRNTMWHLIYQHVKSVSTEDTGSKLGEIGTSEYQMTKGHALAETTGEAENDGNDSSAVASELTENDAIKLVKEAIEGILYVPREPENIPLPVNVKAVSEEKKANIVGENLEKRPSRGLIRFKRLILCSKFIKAMEKTLKSYPQMHKNQEVDSNPEAEKYYLKPSSTGEKKSTDEWMLDYALQKVVSGLAPVQQRRVALLVEAYEKVNPGLDGTNKEFCCIKTGFIDGDPSFINPEEKKDPPFKSSQSSSKLLGDCDPKFEESLVTTSSREIFTSKAPVEVNEKRSPKSKSSALSEQDLRLDDPSTTKTTAFDATKTLLDASEDRTEVEFTKNPQSRESFGERSDKHSDLDAEVVAKPSQVESVEDDWDASRENNTSLDRDKFTSLWCLLVKHVESSGEKMEETPCKIGANAQEGNANTLLQGNNDQNYDNGMDTQTHKPLSFEFQENEAIEVVQNALNEILLPETCDDQTKNTDVTSDQGVSTKADADGRETSSNTTEIAQVETLQDVSATPQEENGSLKENAQNSFSKLSKVLLCKRFIKAMEKMRKSKPQSSHNHAQQYHSGADSTRSGGEMVTRDKKNWEEWMLDNAMQQVVGRLAPVQKKKVALLVQAFEAVGSQRELSPTRE